MKDLTEKEIKEMARQHEHDPSIQLGFLIGFQKCQELNEPKPKGSAKKVFDEFWEYAKKDTCSRKELASLSFDAGHSLRHKEEENEKEYDKAFWWYNLSLTKKKKLFDKHFLDENFDMNKIHKETISILYCINHNLYEDEN